MSVISEIEFRSVPAQRVARLVAKAPGYGPEKIGPVVGPMFGEAFGYLNAAGAELVAPPVADYSDHPDGGGAVQVVVALPVAETVTDVPGLEIAELEAVQLAAVATYHGDMTGIGAAWDELMEGIRAAGCQPHGACREVYLTEGDVPESEWDTLLVQGVWD